jgi:hypothetical protein
MRGPFRATPTTGTGARTYVWFIAHHEGPKALRTAALTAMVAVCGWLAVRTCVADGLAFASQDVHYDRVLLKEVRGGENVMFPIITLSRVVPLACDPPGVLVPRLPIRLP